MNQNLALQEKIDQLGLAGIPNRFVTREGVEVDSSTEEWVVATTSRVSRINFSRIEDCRIAWTCKRYAIHRMQTASAGEGVGFYSAFCELILPRLVVTSDAEASKESLMQAVSAAIKRKLPRQADTSKIELPAWVVRYSAGLSPPSESCGRISL